MFSLLVSDKKGRIFNIPGMEAAGMKAGCFFRPDKEDFIRMPEASRLFMLQGRMPVGYDSPGGAFKAIENYFAVAAFIAPAFTGTYSAAYTTEFPFAEREFPVRRTGKGSSPSILPLFCYTAAGFYKGDIYVTAVRVDRSSRHDPRFIDINSAAKNAVEIKKLFPRNRLIRHLADCALVHGCPGAQNFFLSRQECPLPVSGSCNANCAGCISFQKSTPSTYPGLKAGVCGSAGSPPCKPSRAKSKGSGLILSGVCFPRPKGRGLNTAEVSKNISATQPRIKFTPSPEEVAETALFHSHNVKNAVLSFGQGCEGEPLLEADLIEKSIRLIRTGTGKATININTNASRPKAIASLFDAGLDSIRVSLNSVRQKYYNRYYKPAGYVFGDVLRSMRIAKKKNGFVSINYLTMPGFTDSEDEYKALKKFIEVYKIDMIQWRNLNFDPLAYFRIIKYPARPPRMIGVRQMIQSLQKSFPRLKMGYYNPYIAD